MPRDKTMSHERVIEAARAEFLEKGYEKASMRSIGERAGMTSAGLYRHYTSKEDMFDALVEPAINAIKDWYNDHKATSYKQIDRNASKSELFDGNMIDFARDIMFEHEDEFRLLLTKAQGTKYENFIHDVVRVEQDEFLEALEYLRAKGMNVKMLTKEEMHLIMSAYMTALLEPFIHNMSREQTEHCLDTIEAFFMPGWQNIMGF